MLLWRPLPTCVPYRRLVTSTVESKFEKTSLLTAAASSRHITSLLVRLKKHYRMSLCYHICSWGCLPVPVRGKKGEGEGPTKRGHTLEMAEMGSVWPFVSITAA